MAQSRGKTVSLSSSGAETWFPQIAPTSLDRSRLHAPLVRSATPAARVVLLSASAGAGKSTLMGLWANQLMARGDGVAWVTLRRQDNDVRTLWGSLTQALRATVTRVHGAGARPHPADPLSLLRPPNQFEPSFVRQVATAIGERPHDVWLMLDDVHQLRSSASLRSLDTLIAQAPPNLHLVLGTRADPALRLQRLKPEGRLVEVRNDQLRFTPEEARALLETHGVDLTAAQLGQLISLTEGWAAGLQLASISLAHGRDPEDFLRSFAGDRGPAAGYLVEEVLAELDEATEDFLLATCLPERLTLELAQILSGRDDAGEVLERLADTNSFVMRLGSSGTAYRYHSLLRAYLAAHLAHLSRIRSALQHATAARWFALRGHETEALQHATVATETDLVRDVLQAFGLGMLLAGRQATVVECVEALSPDTLRDPLVGSIAALAFLEGGNLQRADELLAGLHHLSPPAAGDAVEPRWLPGPPLPPERLVSLARLDQMRISGSIRADREVIGALAAVAAGLPPLHHRESSQNLRDLNIAERASLGTSLVLAGSSRAGTEQLRAALDAAREEGRDFVVLQCLVTLALASWLSGELTEMDRWARESIEYAAPRGWGSSARMVTAYALAAVGAYGHCDDATARTSAERAQAILDSETGRDGGPDGAHAVVDWSTLRTLRAMVSTLAFDDASGQPARQRAILGERSSDFEQPETHETAPVQLVYELFEFHRMAVAAGERELADRAVEHVREHVGDSGDAEVMRALRHAHARNDAKARRLLEPVLRGENRPLVTACTLTAWLLEATLAARHDEGSKAHEAVLAALELAAPRGAMRWMLQVSPEVRQLLRDGQGRYGRHEPFVTAVLECADRMEGRPARLDGSLAEGTNPRIHPVLNGTALPLTPRELSLLRDLPSLLTVSELAQARGVSPNTVKTQMRSLFGKLGASSRREAVARGRDDGLL